MSVFRFVVLAAACVAGFAPGASASEPAFVVKPYLQIGRTPGPGSLQLLWHAPEAEADWAVEVREGGKGEWKAGEAPTFRTVAVSGVERHRVYRAPLAGLTPGAAFAYRVRKGGETVFSADATAPKSADQPYRFAVFGDCGAGSAEQKPIAYQTHLARPDLLVIPGDVVYDRGRASEYRTRFWPAYNADEASPAGGAPLLRSTTFVAAPGNHDTATRDLDRVPDALAYYYYWDQPLNGPDGEEGGTLVPKLVASEANRKAFADAAGKTYPRMANFSFDYGNAHWTVLDSNPYVDWTDKALKDWVANDLAAAKGATWRFVAFHHAPFNSAREHYEQQHMRGLAPVFEAGKVDVVFNGHVHNYQRTYPLRFQPDKGGAGYVVVARDGKTPTGRVINGRWTLDKTFDGRRDTTPEGVIYVVTGAGGQDLYNPEQQEDRDSWQGFTDRFVSRIHSLTVADVDGKTLTVRQVSAEGAEVDRFVVTK